MIQGSLARRYAKAILALAPDAKALELLQQELGAFATLLEEQPLLFQALSNQTLPVTERKSAFREISQRMQMSSLARNFLLLLIDKRRMQIFPEVFREIETMADRLRGVLRVKLRYATELSENVKKELLAELEKLTGKQIELETEEEPSLLAGFSAQLGNTVFDGTLATQLQRLERELMQRKTIV